MNPARILLNLFQNLTDIILSMVGNVLSMGGISANFINIEISRLNLFKVFIVIRVVYVLVFIWLSVSVSMRVSSIM